MAVAVLVVAAAAGSRVIIAVVRRLRVSAVTKFAQSIGVDRGLRGPHTDDRAAKSLYIRVIHLLCSGYCVVCTLKP